MPLVGETRGCPIIPLVNDRDRVPNEIARQRDLAGGQG